MRYIRKINGYVEESPIPPYRGAEYYAAHGYLRCDSTLPRLDIVDGEVIELPDPGPTVEQVAAQTLGELTLRAAMLAIPLEDDTTALALSLTVSNRGVLVVLHILLCLSGRLFELAQYVVGDSVQFVGYLYPCALDFLGCYRIGGLGLYLNSVFISVLFAVAISCILLSGALVFFKKRNLK